MINLKSIDKLKTYKRKYLRTASIFGVIGMIIMPLLVFLFASHDSLTNSNISDLIIESNTNLILVLTPERLISYLSQEVNPEIAAEQTNKKFMEKHLLELRK